jgi:Zn finger protein HypA/HybF involved in hydrogenase expression
MSTISFTVSFPTEAGFIGRECSGPSCGRYFKVHEESLHDEMYCPYCGERFRKDELFTNDQLKYAEEQGVELAKEYMYGEIDKMFAGMARRFRSGPVRMTHTPIRYRAKPVAPTYREKRVDSELSCPDCAATFQVFGVFGFCPGCRSENQAVYDANLAILRRELATNKDQGRALRHAYADLVSTFEQFCVGRASDEFRNTQFQDLFEARRAFKQHRGVDILDSLAADELLTLRRVFQKRHAHIHNRGLIGDRYVRKVPEDAKLLGQPAQLSLEEFEAGAKALRCVIDRIVESDPSAA